MQKRMIWVVEATYMEKGRLITEPVPIRVAGITDMFQRRVMLDHARQLRSEQRGVKYDVRPYVPSPDFLKERPKRGQGWAVQLGKVYVRKRDKMVVTINKLTSSKVEYVTHPMLEVWPVKRASFMNNFRPATAEEAKEAK